jgi:hypothetical protein
MREVDGFELGNIPRADPQPSVGMPSYVPLIYHGNRRADPLNVAAAAVPFHQLYSRRDASLRYKTRAEISAAFRFTADARIIAVGCGRDKPIETWWGLSAKRGTAIAALQELGIQLTTSPNYSLFTDQPRYDDMYNIKRIGTAWQEFVGGGVPCALHLNARTLRDYERLARFVNERVEVTDVAFEFGTGAAWPARQHFHHRHLAWFGQQVEHPLRLIMIGGLPALPALVPAYAAVTYIDTSAFMNTMHRQRLVEGNDGRLTKKTELTKAGVPLDALFAWNMETMRRRVERLISASHPKAV